MDQLNTSVNSIGARLDLTEANLLEQSNKLEAQELLIKALDNKLEEALITMTIWRTDPGEGISVCFTCPRRVWQATACRPTWKRSSCLSYPFL